MWNRKRRLLVTAWCLFSASASADVPPLLPIQGYLTDTAGAPIDGNRKITFTLYDNASAMLFQEVKAVSIKSGEFVAYLGDQRSLPLDIFSDQALVFVGLQVENDPEMTPRFQLGLVPYAAEAANATMVGGIAAEDLQRRITGMCSTGQAAIGINADGSLLCAAIGSQSGSSGLNCWDTDQDGTCDPAEDIDGSGCSVADCRASGGAGAGATGKTSTTGFGLSVEARTVAQASLTHSASGTVIAIGSGEAGYTPGSSTAGYPSVSSWLNTSTDAAQSGLSTVTWNLATGNTGLHTITSMATFPVTGSGTILVNFQAASGEGSDSMSLNRPKLMLWFAPN